MALLAGRHGSRRRAVLAPRSAFMLLYARRGRQAASGVGPWSPWGGQSVLDPCWIRGCFGYSVRLRWLRVKPLGAGRRTWLNRAALQRQVATSGHPQPLPWPRPARQRVLGRGFGAGERVSGDCGQVDGVLLMTEAEWLVGNEPGPMLASLKDIASPRKLRLFAVACGRRIRKLFHDALSGKALDLIEQFSDGQVDKEVVYDFLYSNMQEEIVSDRFSFAQVFGVAAWWNITIALIDVRLDVVRQLATELTGFRPKGESMCQCYCLYDIFANPTRPTIMASVWRSPKATTVAQTIYDNRAFDRMPNGPYLATGRMRQ